ncbi:MAG: hypothetical protein AAF216_11900 [Pseudomonadota bacterium]
MRYAAAFLATLTALIHIVMGGSDTLKPMMASETLPTTVSLTLQGSWHSMSAFLSVSAYVFLRNWGGTRMFASVWLGAGAIFTLLGLLSGGPSGLLELPQGLLLIPTALCAIAARNQALQDPVQPA